MPLNQLKPIFEDKDQHAGLHALIVGVSDYEFLPPSGEAGGANTLGFSKLNSPALSAYRLARYLIENKNSRPWPLASVRLLLSASPAEKAAEPALKDNVFPRPDFDTFSHMAWKWWEDASASRDSATFFYFAGHGMRIGGESALFLLDDFGAPNKALSEAIVNLNEIIAGMAPHSTAPDIARTQFYFFDACRNGPGNWENVVKEPNHKVFGRLGREMGRVKPVIFATPAGGEAIGIEGQVSLFCKALLEALEIACDIHSLSTCADKCPVTMQSLLTYIGLQYEAYAAQGYGKIQRPVADGVPSTDLVIRYLPTPPKIKLRIQLEPPDCVGGTQVTVSREGNVVAAFPNGNSEYPYTVDAPMAIYEISVKPPAPFAPKKQFALLDFRSHLSPVVVHVPQ
jgi:hypothetical protein